MVRLLHYRDVSGTFPFEAYESETRSVMSNSLQPRGLYSPWTSLGQNTGVGRLLHTSPGDCPNTGIEPRSLTLQAYSLPSEPPGKPLKHVFFCKSQFVHVEGMTV